MRLKALRSTISPWKNNDLQRTRGIPAKDNASRHAKGERLTAASP